MDFNKLLDDFKKIREQYLEMEETIYNALVYNRDRIKTKIDTELIENPLSILVSTLTKILPELERLKMEIKMLNEKIENVEKNLNEKIKEMEKSKSVSSKMNENEMDNNNNNDNFKIYFIPEELYGNENNPPFYFFPNW